MYKSIEKPILVTFDILGKPIYKINDFLNYIFPNERSEFRVLMDNITMSQTKEEKRYHQKKFKEYVSQSENKEMKLLFEASDNRNKIVIS